MKHYVFGDTVKGFIDYLRSIWRMKADIKNYEYSRNAEYKQYRYEDYREAKEIYEQVWKAIVEARIEACYNRRQLAEILGISYNALKLYEEGKRTLPLLSIIN